MNRRDIYVRIEKFNDFCRENLQNAKGRVIFCSIIPIISSVILLVTLRIVSVDNETLKKIWDSHDPILKFFAGITAALSLMTYNLRNKALDYFQKLISSKTIIDEKISDALLTARLAGIKITNLTLKSFTCMLLLGWCSYFTILDSWFDNIALSIGIGLLISCIFSYVYVIFRMEYIEVRFLKLLAIQEEIERLRADSEHHQANLRQEESAVPNNW